MSLSSHPSGPALSGADGQVNLDLMALQQA
jgi:hypothetical protein